MEYSDKLNGFWEEGYHFYFEIRDENLTVREYRRKVTLQTKISYDADSVEAGRKTPIKLEDNVLSYGGADNPMSWFEEFTFEDGEIRLVEGYSFMDRKDPYTMNKVDHGPFDHIVIRDEEFHDRLQGVWIRWSADGDYSKGKRQELVIRDQEFYWGPYRGKFHVISYDRGYDRNQIYLVPWDLTESDFGGCTRFEVYPDMLTSREIIFDINTPLSVFAREEDIDRIMVPEDARSGYRNTMGPGAAEPMIMYDTVGPTDFSGMNAPTAFPGRMGIGMMDAFKRMTAQDKNPLMSEVKAPEPDDGIRPEFLPCEKEGDDPRRLKKPYTCKGCGQVFEDRLPKFCFNCGGVL